MKSNTQTIHQKQSTAALANRITSNTASKMINEKYANYMQNMQAKKPFLTLCKRGTENSLYLTTQKQTHANLKLDTTIKIQLFSFKFANYFVMAVKKYNIVHFIINKK